MGDRGLRCVESRQLLGVGEKDVNLLKAAHLQSMALVTQDRDFIALWTHRVRKGLAGARGLIFFKNTTDILSRLDAAFGVIEAEFERAQATRLDAPFVEIRDKSIVLHR
jgi:hypothetical protein